MEFVRVREMDLPRIWHFDPRKYQKHILDLKNGTRTIVTS